MKLTFLFSIAFLIGCASKPKLLMGTQTICDNNGICVVHPFDLTAWRRIEPTGVLPLWAKRAPNVNQIAFKGGASYCPSPYYVQADFTGYKNGTGTWTNHCYLKKDISHPLDGRASWECIPGTEHPVGQAKHVTRSQWEAAQGLYHSSLACNDRQHWKMITVKGDLPPGEYVKGWERDTFWYCAEGYPSGDAK